MNLTNLDKTSFTNKPYIFRNEKPWGYELIFTNPHLPYTGKILHIYAGKRLSLQVHDQKLETIFVLSGDLHLIIDNVEGELETIKIQKGHGYNVQPGQRHRYQAITDCDVYEVSTPEIGTTYRLEDDFKRSDETEDLRNQERTNA